MRRLRRGDAGRRIDVAHQAGDGRGNQVLPRLACSDAAANLGRGVIVIAAIHRQRANAPGEMGRCDVLALPRGDQEPKLFEHPFDRMSRAVVPAEHSFGGVAAAEKLD